MRPSKSSVGVSVKQVIGVLCRLLSAVGLHPVPGPETFRRAKFGGKAEEEVFWKLLSDVLQTARVISSKPDSQQKGERRKLVSSGLWHRGYHASWMFEEGGAASGGGGGEEEAFSSRDLLLALGWLLAEGILEKLVMQRVQQLDRTLLTSSFVSPSFPAELQVEPASLRRLQWLTGRRRHQGRSRLSSLVQRTGLVHRECVGVEQVCDLLEAFVNWKQVEELYWSWMESVVDCHQTHAVCSANQSPGNCHHGNQQLKKLEEMLLKLPSSQGQSFSSSDVTSTGEQKDRDELCASVLRSPPHSSLSSSPLFSPVYRARFRPDGGRPAEEPEGGNHLLASQAVLGLRDWEAALLDIRSRQRRVNRAELQEMYDRKKEVVLIPP